jgi:ornithine decarboxylase
MTIENIHNFLDKSSLETPCLVMDLSIVKKSYIELNKFFPDSLIYYAVKANPAIEIINCLNNVNSHFDVSSKKEIELCLSQSINPTKLSYGSTVKKDKDILWAHKKGVKLFAFDSLEELKKINVRSTKERAYPIRNFLSRRLSTN